MTTAASTLAVAPIIVATEAAAISVDAMIEFRHPHAQGDLGGKISNRATKQVPLHTHPRLGDGGEEQVEIFKRVRCPGQELGLAPPLLRRLGGLAVTALVVVVDQESAEPVVEFGSSPPGGCETSQSLRPGILD